MLRKIDANEMYNNRRHNHMLSAAFVMSVISAGSCVAQAAPKDPTDTTCKDNLPQRDFFRICGSELTRLGKFVGDLNVKISAEEAHPSLDGGETDRQLQDTRRRAHDSLGRVFEMMYVRRKAESLGIVPPSSPPNKLI
jgi:hypothetical protein